MNYTDFQFPVCPCCGKECETHIRTTVESYEQFGNCFTETTEAEVSNCCDEPVGE